MSSTNSGGLLSSTIEKKIKCLFSSFGAFKKITTHLDDKMLFVETEMKKTDDETSSKTINAYNRFLELVTGHTAKERMKKARAGKD